MPIHHSEHERHDSFQLNPTYFVQLLEILTRAHGVYQSATENSPPKIYPKPQLQLQK